MFTMPAMVLKGTITGFEEPQGMCTDESGNILDNEYRNFPALPVLARGHVTEDAQRSDGYPSAAP